MSIIDYEGAWKIILHKLGKMNGKIDSGIIYNAMYNYPDQNDIDKIDTQPETEEQKYKKLWETMKAWEGKLTSGERMTNFAHYDKMLHLERGESYTIAKEDLPESDESKGKGGKFMKSYKAFLKQEKVYEGELEIQAESKAQAKEVINDLIYSCKIQHLITDEDGDFITGDLECNGWKLVSIEDY